MAWAWCRLGLGRGLELVLGLELGLQRDPWRPSNAQNIIFLQWERPHGQMPGTNFTERRLYAPQTLEPLFSYANRLLR